MHIARGNNRSRSLTAVGKESAEVSIDLSINIACAVL